MLLLPFGSCETRPQNLHRQSRRSSAWPASPTFEDLFCCFSASGSCDKASFSARTWRYLLTAILPFAVLATCSALMNGVGPTPVDQTHTPNLMISPVLRIASLGFSSFTAPYAYCPHMTVPAFMAFLFRRTGCCCHNGKDIHSATRKQLLYEKLTVLILQGCYQ